MLVPAWASWDHFYELDRKGLMMFGQMTAGYWIYIGTQGILLQRVLTTDPGTGVMRHADAGYDRAIEVAHERGVRVPILKE